MATRDQLLKTLIRQDEATLMMLATEYGVDTNQEAPEIAYQLSAAMASPVVEQSTPQQITARQAVPGTVVYISVAEGGRNAGVREHAVRVGAWRPSVSCGAGWADLIDDHGKFWTVAAADDLLYVEPAARFLPISPLSYI